MSKPVARAGPWLLGGVCLAVLVLASPTLPEAAADTLPVLGEDLLIEATSPGTAAITSMRDIVL